jgi:predicted Fe-Mo cluster-binding NifX family protein
MKIAISAEGASLDASVSRRFGICPYLIIVDLDTGEWEAIENPGSSGNRGAGVEAVVLVISKGVEGVLTGYCSPSIKGHLESNNIDVITGLRGTVADVMGMYAKGEIQKVRDLSSDTLNRWGVLNADTIKNAFKTSFNQFVAMLPVLFGVVLLMGLVNALIPGFLLAALFSGSAIIDTLWGACLGSIIAGNPVNSYVIGAELLKEGVSLFAVTALIIAWVTVGLIQLPAEMAALGRRFALVRNAVCFILCIPIAFVTVVILNALTG